ncbi:hypothetical protein ACKWTF_001667 [Chironomus riparius]
MITQIMIGNGNSVKKPTTNFTIECILSKKDRKENGDLSRTNSNHMHHQSHHPLTLNKVLDNPWISKTPLALSFNPSSYHRKLNFSNPLPPTYQYLPSTPPLTVTPPILQSGSNYIQNLVKTTQHHTSVHNHFYSVASNEAASQQQQQQQHHQLQPIKNYSIMNNTHPAILSSPSSLSLEKDLNLSKMNVYDCNKLCDTQLLSEDLKKVVDNKSSLLSINEIKCSICSKFFDNSELMDIHMKSHAKPKFACSQCDKQFSQLRNFKYHMSIHLGTKEFAASCPECGKTFNDKGYLSSHLKIHRNKKEHACPYCPKSFNQRVAFNMHVRIHLGLKPHCCQECGKTFSRKMLLKQHYRTHSGEKPYVCSFEGCEKRFADRSNMILHFRLHSGIKPFSCNLCPKRFSKKHHLGTHLNYHLNLKPYSCLNEGCTQKFTQSSNMRTHMKKCPHRKVEEK